MILSLRLSSKSFEVRSFKLLRLFREHQSRSEQDAYAAPSYITESSMLMPTVTHVGKGGLPAGVGDLKAESAQ